MKKQYKIKNIFKISMVMLITLGFIIPTTAITIEKNNKINEIPEEDTLNNPNKSSSTLEFYEVSCTSFDGDYTEDGFYDAVHVKMDVDASCYETEWESVYVFAELRDEWDWAISNSDAYWDILGCEEPYPDDPDSNEEWGELDLYLPCDSEGQPSIYYVYLELYNQSSEYQDSYSSGMIGLCPPEWGLESITSCFINPYDSDSDGFNDAASIEIDVDTHPMNTNVEVEVTAYLIDSFFDVADDGFQSWTINGIETETHTLQLQVSNYCYPDMYNIKIYLNEDGDDYEDYYQSSAELFPPSFDIDVCFADVIYTPIDTEHPDNDGYNDGLNVKMDVNTDYQMSTNVRVEAYLKDSTNNIIDSNTALWSIYSDNVEWEELDLYVPYGAQHGSYHVQLKLFDNQNNQDDGDISPPIELWPEEWGSEYINEIIVTPLDQNSDNYNDAIQLQIDANTHPGHTLSVFASTTLKDPNQNVVETKSDIWSITGENTEYGTTTLQVPAGSPEGIYTWEIILEDDTGNQEDTDTGTQELYPPDYQPVKEWTFIVYMDADNDLEEGILDDFLEMSSVGSTDDINIVAQLDRVPGYKLPDPNDDDTRYGDWTDTRRGIINNGDVPSDGTDGNPAWGVSIGEADMGNTQTLSNFVNWAIDNYTANHYCLVLEDHGNGWFLKNGDEPPVRKVCDDYSTPGGSYLTIIDLQNALMNINSHLQNTQKGANKLEILGFDACLMGMVEVYYQLKNDTTGSPLVDIVIGSEETIPFWGWPYTTILNDLKNNPTQNGCNFAPTIVTEYINSYVGIDDDATLAAFNMMKIIQYVEPAVDNLAQRLQQTMALYHNEILTSIQLTEGYSMIYPDICDSITDYVDLYDFAYEITQHINGNEWTAQEIRNLANIVMQSIDDARIGTAAAGHLSGHPDSHGLSIYFETTQFCYESFDKMDYKQISFAQATKWDEFLEAFYTNPDKVCGDANSDGAVNVGDAVFIINYCFRGGFTPYPLCLGDANGDGSVDVGDAVYLISYSFKGGPKPVKPSGCDCIIP